MRRCQFSGGRRDEVALRGFGGRAEPWGRHVTWGPFRASLHAPDRCDGLPKSTTRTIKTTPAGSDGGYWKPSLLALVSNICNGAPFQSPPAQPTSLSTWVLRASIPPTMMVVAPAATGAFLPQLRAHLIPTRKVQSHLELSRLRMLSSIANSCVIVILLSSWPPRMKS